MSWDCTVQNVGPCTVRLHVEQTGVPVGDTATGAVILTGDRENQVVRLIRLAAEYRGPRATRRVADVFGERHLDATPTYGSETVLLETDVRVAAGVEVLLPFAHRVRETAHWRGSVRLVLRAAAAPAWLPAVASPLWAPFLCWPVWQEKTVALSPPSGILSLASALAESAAMEIRSIDRSPGGGGFAVDIAAGPEAAAQRIKLLLFPAGGMYEADLMVDPRPARGTNASDGYGPPRQRIQLRLPKTNPAAAREKLETVVGWIRCGRGDAADLPIPDRRRQEQVTNLPRPALAGAAPTEALPRPCEADELGVR